MTERDPEQKDEAGVNDAAHRTPRSAAGAGRLPDGAPEQPTSGMNSTTGRGRGSGTPGGVYGGGGGTTVSHTQPSVGHESEQAPTDGGVAVPFGRGSNVGTGDQGLADTPSITGGLPRGLREGDLGEVQQAEQTGMGADAASDALVNPEAHSTDEHKRRPQTPERQDP